MLSEKFSLGLKEDTRTSGNLLTLYIVAKVLFCTIYGACCWYVRLS